MTVIIAVAVIVTHCGSLRCVASQYGDGVMSEVIHNRNGGRPDVVQLGFVPRLPAIAVCDCLDVGGIRAVRRVGSNYWQSVFVADCGHPTQLRDDGRTGCQWMADEGVLFEMSAPLARMWDVLPGYSCPVEMMRWELRQMPVDEVEGPHLVIEDEIWP